MGPSSVMLSRPAPKLSEMDVLRHEAQMGREGTRSPVQAAMSAPAQVIAADAEVSEAAARMLDQELGALPVVDGARLIGIITTRDVLGFQARRRSPPSMAAWPARAKDVMMRSPQVVREDDDLLDAVARMVRKGVRHLPVVDGEGRAVGMLSDADVRSAAGDLSRVGTNDSEANPRVRAMKVAHAMTAPALIAHQDEPLPEVARHFLDWRVSALRVVNETERVVGIISYLDLLDAVYSHFWDIPGKETPGASPNAP
jgi:CBS domain-containing protein